MSGEAFNARGCCRELPGLISATPPAVLKHFVRNLRLCSGLPLAKPFCYTSSAEQLLAQYVRLYYYLH